MEKKGVFLREATGLVRGLGTLDALWVNISLLGLLFSTFFVASAAPVVGGDALLGTLLPIAGFFLVGIVFVYIGSKVPRVAADYVYVSRFLSPPLGFVGNAGYFVSAVPVFMGITGVVIQSFGLIPMLYTLGYYYNNPSLTSLAGTLSTPSYMLTLGALEIILPGLIPLFGTRVFRTVQRVIIPLAILGALTILAVEIAVPSSTAINNLNTFANSFGFSGNLYNNVTANSAAAPASINFVNTLSLNAVYVVGFSFIISSIYIAGEVRNVRKSMIFSMLGTLLVAAFFFAVITFFEYRQFGYGFISQYTNLALYQFVNPIPTAPYVNLLAAVASGSVIVSIFIFVVTLLQLLSYQVSASFVGSRLLFSYSIDKVLPAFVADINPRFHAPVKAIAITIIFGLIGLLLFSIPVTSSTAFALSGIGVAIVILFPEIVACAAVAKTAWKAERKYAVIAIISIPYLIFTLYQYLTVPAIGANLPLSYQLLAGEIILLFVIFYVSKVVRKRQGVPLDLIFKEIPPE